VVADKAKYVKFESDHQILQTRYESELKSRKEEQKSHSEILASILESKQAETSKPDPQLHALKTENARLTLENTNLKAAASTYRSQPTLSPVPSSASSNSDVKDDNVRKMYIKVKRQYETLQSAATKLVTCTRSMDLTSFGEFGTYIKRLRGALDGNRDGEDGGSQGSSTAMVVRKDEDDDDTWGSQRSG
jgi:regulator of replication initiation timing